MMIRKMEARDIDAVMMIFNYYIENTNCNWQREARPRAFYENWLVTHDDAHPAFVLEDEGKVAGFASLSAFRGVNGYDKILENTVYVLPGFQGKGYGGQLMQTLIDQGKRLGLWAITAWIDSDNAASIAFHEKFGFYEVGVMKNIGNKGNARLSVSILQLDFV